MNRKEISFASYQVFGELFEVAIRESSEKPSGPSENFLCNFDDGGNVCCYGVCN